MMQDAEANGEARVLTIGHSTRSRSELFELLRTHEVSHLVDVRTVPRSRHNPQFNKTELEDACPDDGFTYTHLKVLGGLRKTRPDSPNGGWRNASFRGYADYMQTDEFEAGLKQLLEFSRRERIAIMCAEAVPWRCHRSLIADALTVRGLTVKHILNDKRLMDHALTRFALVEGERITYPAERSGDLFERNPD